MRTSLLVAASLLVLGTGTARAQQRLDQQFVADSEFFVADQDYNGGWQWVVLARMVRPPSDTTHGEAQFMSMGGNRPAGERFWSRYFWSTKLATPADLKIGKVVFCADLSEGDVYRAPRNRHEVVENRWWMATITDDSDAYKQQLLMGDYRANIGALRVAVH